MFENGQIDRWIRPYFSDIPINSLAKSLGYDDPFYFSKIFKKHTNLSPSQFRSIERYKS